MRKKKKKNVKRLNYLLIYKSDLSSWCCGGCILLCAAASSIQLLHIKNYFEFDHLSVIRIFASVTSIRAARACIMTTTAAAVLAARLLRCRREIEEQQDTRHTNDLCSVTKRLHTVRIERILYTDSVAYTEAMAHSLNEQFTQ